MAARRLSQGQPLTQAARRHSHEERLLRRAIGMAHMGYWESQSADAADFWISPELAAFYELETSDGFIPIACVRERYLPASRELLQAHYAACWSGGPAYAVHARLMKPDDRIVDCMVHGEPECDEHGRVQRVIGIVRDVTEETSVLRRLAESEQRLADFVSTASDWCWERNSKSLAFSMLRSNANFPARMSTSAIISLITLHVINVEFSTIAISSILRRSPTFCRLNFAGGNSN